MRIVFYASYPNQPIGYSKVAYQLSNYLAEKQEITEFIYVGIGNIVQTRLTGRLLHPKIQFVDVLVEEETYGIQDGYGPSLIADILEKFQPDIFFIYNDIIVTCRILNALLQYRASHRQTRFVSYLDLVYPFQKLDYIQHVHKHTDQIFVFSDCWKQNLIVTGIPSTKIQVFPHGFSDSIFFPIPKQLARQFLNLREHDFIVLNTNRNTYRKCQDITISGFLEFYSRQPLHVRPRLKLFLNCTLDTRSGYNIEDIVKVECLKRGLSSNEIVQSTILRFSNSGDVSDHILNELMNATDVGVNTCCGEGFGLCNLEHAGIGRPQIVSDVGALHDIFAEKGDTITLPVRYIMRAPNSLDEHSGDLYYVSSSDFADALEMYYTHPSMMEEHGNAVRTRICTKYNWDILLRQFWENLTHIQ